MSRIKVISFSEPHLWYADKIEQVFDLQFEGTDFFQVQVNGMPKRIKKTDGELLKMQVFKILCSVCHEILAQTMSMPEDEIEKRLPYFQEFGYLFAQKCQHQQDGRQTYERLENIS